MDKIKVYLACSFAYSDRSKTNERKSIMDTAQALLESHNFSVYNPSHLKIENAWDYSMWDWGNLVFQRDKQELDDADFVIFISYGKENNAGAVWEVGYAYALGKKIITVSMDVDAPESLMIIHSSWACLDGLDGLYKYDFKTMPRLTIERTES